MLRDTLEGEPPNLFSALRNRAAQARIMLVLRPKPDGVAPTIKLNHDSEEKHVD
jgi:hypothetical protein